MAKQKIETSIEINGIDVVAYPLVESDHVTFENGMSINEMIKGDVATPVVTHEEISFKVGKGDSDVSSSIVDGSVGEMTIKGQTYQNILPEPSLRNSMSNGKTTQKINEGYDNVNVVDGVGKSAILKGCTLVNVANQIHVINYVEQPKADYITLVHTGNENAKSIRLKNNGLLKPNTKYLIMLDVVENTLTTKMQISKNAALCGFNDIEMYPIKAGQTGVVKLIVTSKNEFINVRDYLYLTTLFGQIGDGTQQIKLRIMLLEYQDGMENWDIPYFEGMTSVKAPTVKTVGKNLFDKDNFTRDFVVSKTGTLVAQTGDGVTDYIRVLKGKTYNKKGSNSLAIYDIDKKFIKRSDSSVNRYTAESDGYIRWNIDSYNRTDGYANGLNSLQIEEGTTVTTYEPHKSNTLTTPSDLTLRRIGDVYDTLDLVSGEKVERIGEVVLDGSEYWREISWNGLTRPIYRLLLDIHSDIQFNSNHIRCNMFPIGCGAWTDSEHIWIDNYNGLTVHTNRFSSLEEFKSYINNSNLIVQYTVSESIKKVDLSSSGNWEKVVLDGSEDEGWGLAPETSHNNAVFLANVLNDNLKVDSNNINLKPISNHYTSYIQQQLCNKPNKYYGVSFGWNNNTICIRDENFEFTNKGLEQFKQYLSQNPITVWYQTTTHKDSTQVKQPLSFSNGHVQLSSKEGSLIPSLDYEVPTSNSYHLDLAKTSTQYTMKNMSGTFTIDNNNYNASANSAFTTPTSMANKLMITSVVQSNVMLLEGSLTSKTIPYFKGIKSAFEGKDKIEVLSTGRNLVNLDNAILNSNHQKVVTKIENGFNIKFTYNPNNFSGWDNAIRLRVDVKPNTNYVLSLTKIVRKDPYQGITPLPLWVSGYTWVRQGDSHHDSLTEGNLTNGLPTVMKFNSRNFNYVTLDICSTPSRPAQDGDFDIVDIQIEESSTATPYEPYKSNITKIPLSSPLRSLPNGVCDEVILDRENNKVKVIQRVGYEVFDGSENWQRDSFNFANRNFLRFITFLTNVKTNGKGLCDKLPVLEGDKFGVNYIRPSIDRTWIYKADLTVTTDSFVRELSNDPLMLHYELATPIITEIDLDGYPYIYKDGHIFLNSKIAPTTTMKYSINQSHQIASQNGDLIRHEKEINYLYTLIAKYVNVQYESTLLNLDLELSRA